MKTSTLVLALSLLCLTAASFALSGCNTWEGAGKDVERAGEKMQD